MASQSKVNVASASIKTQIELTGRGMTQAMYLSHVQNGIMTSLSLGKYSGVSQEFWSLVSTIDGSTLPQDCVEEQRC